MCIRDSQEIEGYVARVILAQYKIREATNYAPPLRLLWKKYHAPQPVPVFVIFVTDGGNTDRTATSEVIREPVSYTHLDVYKRQRPHPAY